MPDPVAPVPPAADAAAPAAQAPVAAPAAPEAPKPEAPKPRAWSPKAKPAPAEPAPAPAVAASADPAKPKGVSGIGSRKIAALESKLAASAKDVEEAKALREELGHYAKRELEAAPENARKYVLSKHKDDPRAQLAALRELRDSGLLNASAPPAPAANTMASTSPKPAAANDEDVALAQQWLESSKRAPMRAASLRLQHSSAIERGLKKLQAS